MERLKILYICLTLAGCQGQNIHYSPKYQIVMSKVVKMPGVDQAKIQSEQDQQIQMYINSHQIAKHIISSIDEHAYIIHLLNKKLWDLDEKVSKKATAKKEAKGSAQNTSLIPEEELGSEPEIGLDKIFMDQFTKE